MRGRLLIVSLIAAFTFFAGLGRAAISESDEAFYAEAGREMLESGDWLTPHFNYEPRFQKPILYYWVVAASYRVAGVTEAAARFGSALSGLGLAVLTFAAARRMFDGDTAFTAGAIVATSFGYFAMSHLSLPDLPLTFFVTLTIWLGFRVIDDPDRGALLAGASIAAALGILTKGPLGVLLPALVLGPVVVLERRWVVLRPATLAAALAICAAVAVPWYAAMTWTHGAGYLGEFLLGDNVERFATPRFNDPRAPWYYLPVIAGGLLPWTPFVALLAAPAWRWVRRRRALATDERRLVIWTLLPLAFFTISIGKQARYILPILPPLAMLIARAIQLRIRSAPPSARPGTARAAALASALVLLLVAVTLWRIRPLLAYSTNAATITAAVVLIAIVGVAAAIVVLAAPRRAMVPALALASAVTLAALQYGVFSTPRSEPVEVAAAMIGRARQAREPIGVYHALVRNLVFYTHVQHIALHDREQARAFLSGSDRVLCVMLASEAEQLAAAGVPFVRLAELRYFDPATMKLKAVLAPDPQRDLTSIVLAASK